MSCGELIDAGEGREGKRNKDSNFDLIFILQNSTIVLIRNSLTFELRIIPFDCTVHHVIQSRACQVSDHK